MIEPINPAEALLVTVGLRSIISHQVERFTKGKLSEMMTLPNRVERMARDVVLDCLTETFYSSLNYRAMLKDLSAGVDMSQVQKMVSGFPPEFQAAGAALMIIAQQVIAKLGEQFPTSSYQTVAGLTSLLPDDAKLWRFISTLEVLDNPLLIFPLMATGALLRSQTMAVRSLYPTLSAHIDAWLLDATIKAKAAKKSFELSPRAEVGVKAWMLQSPVSKEMLMSAQTAVQSAKTKQAEKIRQHQSKLAGMSETASQRTDMKAP